MALFSSAMTPQKAIEALGSDKEAKYEKGIEFLKEGGADLLPFMVEKFQSLVPQAARSSKHKSAANRLYDLLCEADLPAELCPPFLETLISAPENLEFSIEKLPADTVMKGYAFLETTLKESDVEVKKKVLPFFDKIFLPPSILPILASFLNQKSGFAEESLKLLPQIDGDLSPVSDTLYDLLDVYLLGDFAAQTIFELSGRLSPNLKKLEQYLMEFSSPVQRRTIRVAVLLAETNPDVYALLEKAILADESARAHILELLEKKETLRPDQIDLSWMILVNTDSDLTKERGLRFFGRIEETVRPLISHYAKNGTSNEIACAFKCLLYMKEEGAAICAEVLPIYLSDDRLLFETSGYENFSVIAASIKANFGNDSQASALAKKMRDYCTRNDLETPTEVMSLLAPEELADLIEWSFKRIFESYGIGYTPQYADEMLHGIGHLVGFEAPVLNAFIKAIGFVYHFDSSENAPLLTHKETAASINRLRSQNTPATSNILHLISRKRDLKIDQTDSAGTVVSSFTLSFEEHRRLALDELERRGFPAYNPIHYLKQDKSNY
ncbi:MAG: hypothetical protein RBQ94_01300 [Methanimicrococcus sp.]|nr:hypothetical protein [Methanimicrococcus sp.]